ncbi:MAG: ABC transporter permease subunit [Candidatus Sericytochromatia bacterium]|nr:ABC transporter permease subunit [Candidatus Tanganyikabacteria bacterium]
MNTRRMGWLLWREALDLWRNRRLFVGVIVVPLVLAAGMMPGLLAIVARTEQAVSAQVQVMRVRQELLGERVEPRSQKAGRGQAGPNPVALLHPRLANEPAGRQVLWLIVLVSLGYITIFPLVLPLTTAANALVQERTEGTLEPVLATPVATHELLWAKVLGASLPPVAITWLSWCIQLGVAAHFLGWPAVRDVLVTPGWVMVVFGGAPAASMLVTLVLVLLSARIPDARAAQQWGALVVLPAMGLQAALLSGAVRTDGVLPWILLPWLLLLWPAYRMAVRVFDRGAILALRR